MHHVWPVVVMQCKKSYIIRKEIPLNTTSKHDHIVDKEQGYGVEIHVYLGLYSQMEILYTTSQ